MAENIYISRKHELIKFYRHNERMPSYEEMSSIFGVSSKGSLHKYVKKFVDEGLIGKTETGRLLPTTKLYGLRVLGTVQAGFPTPAEEELVDTMSMDEFLIANPQSCFLLTINGDSMIDAGIMEKDMVIIDRSLTPKNGDIVVAEVDHDWTVKYYFKEKGQVFLRPANKKFSDIYPRDEMRVAGVVTSVVRKYH